MNQKKATQAKRTEAEKEADMHYQEFEEMMMQVYGVRKYGYLWENKKTLDKSSPDYKREKDFDIDNSIIQSSIGTAIVSICEAALSLIDYGSEKRTKYFKTAILYCEEVTGFEHCYTMAAIALKKNSCNDYFRSVVKKYEGVKNVSGEVIIDIESFMDKLNAL